MSVAEKIFLIYLLWLWFVGYFILIPLWLDLKDRR